MNAAQSNEGAVAMLNSESSFGLSIFLYCVPGRNDRGVRPILEKCWKSAVKPGVLSARQFADILSECAIDAMHHPLDSTSIDVLHTASRFIRELRFTADPQPERTGSLCWPPDDLVLVLKKTLSAPVRPSKALWVLDEIHGWVQHIVKTFSDSTCQCSQSSASMAPKGMIDRVLELLVSECLALFALALGLSPFKFCTYGLHGLFAEVVRHALSKLDPMTPNCCRLVQTEQKNLRGKQRSSGTPTSHSFLTSRGVSETLQNC
jgi:hypothetical protein